MGSPLANTRGTACRTGAGINRYAAVPAREKQTTAKRSKTMEDERDLMLQWVNFYGSAAKGWELFAERVSASCLVAVMLHDSILTAVSCSTAVLQVVLPGVAECVEVCSH